MLFSHGWPCNPTIHSLHSRNIHLRTKLNTMVLLRVLQRQPCPAASHIWELVLPTPLA